MKKFNSIVLSIVIVFLFSSLLFAGEVILTWTANTEPDLAGYNLYYKWGDPNGPPYCEKVDVGNVVEYTVIELDPNQVPYYFVITAHDTSGLESSYSNEVVVRRFEMKEPRGLKRKMGVNGVVPCI